MSVLCNIKTRSRNHCYSGKAIGIIYSESLILAFACYGKGVRAIVLPPVACLALSRFFHIIS